jgi:hypothetical protein
MTDYICASHEASDMKSTCITCNLGVKYSAAIKYFRTVWRIAKIKVQMRQIWPECEVRIRRKNEFADILVWPSRWTVIIISVPIEHQPGTWMMYNLKRHPKKIGGSFTNEYDLAAFLHMFAVLQQAAFAKTLANIGVDVLNIQDIKSATEHIRNYTSLRDDVVRDTSDRSK